MSRSFLILLLISVDAMNEFGAALAADNCNTNSDCSGYYAVCCRGYYYYYSYNTRRSCRHNSCSGRYCSSDGDCGGKGECCLYSMCNAYTACAECYSNSDCSSGEYCCKQRYTSDDNVCRRNCLGQTCGSDSDCGGPNEECDSDKKCASYKTSTYDKKSTSSGYSGAAWVAPVIVVCVLLFVVFCAANFWFRWRKYRQARNGVVVIAPAPQRTTAVIALRETEVHTTAPAPVYKYPRPAYHNQRQNNPPHVPQDDPNLTDRFNSSSP